MLKKAEFYFIRHGVTDWNLEGRTMGQKDIPLNESGILQAQKAALILQQAPIKTICYSPLYRAKKTAEILNETLKCPMVEMDALKECRWGMVEGQLKGDGTHFEKWVLGEVVPEGAETYQEFVKRALEGVNAALEYPMPLIVSHGGVYWAIQKFLGQDQFLGQDHRVIKPSLQNCTPYYHKVSNNESLQWDIIAVE